MNWADLIIGICFGAVIMMIVTPRRKRNDEFRAEPGARMVPPPHDYVKELEQVEARVFLEETFEFVTPPYGQYLGQKVPLNKVTKEMKQSSAYLPPHEMGRWVRKGTEVKWD